MEFTGERMIPELNNKQAIYLEHVTRYAFASQFIKTGMKVLDAACGSGYGSKLLAEKDGVKVSGIDVSQEAIDYARGHYSGANVSFELADIRKIPYEDDYFDLIVSFETIEHIKEHDLFLSEVSRVLKDDGIFIVSTPNRDNYHTDNEFHEKELNAEEFQSLLSGRFKFVDSYRQGNNLSSAVYRQSSGFENLDLDWLAGAKEENDYLLAVCSNFEISRDYKDCFRLGSDELLDDLKKLSFDSRRKHNYIRDLETASEGKQDWIKRLEEEILKLQGAVKDLDELSVEKQGWIVKLEKDIKEMDTALLENQDLISKLRAEIRRYEILDYPTVDIVSINYNSKQYIDKYLEAVGKIDYPKSRLRIFLVDNGSVDDSWEYVERRVKELEMDNVILIKSLINTGFAGGNNIAFNISKADYLFILNIDTEVESDCLKILVEEMGKDMNIGIVEAKQTPNEHPKYYDKETGDSSWSSGACSLIRRKALIETGNFDRDFFLYCEDVDLSWRMWSHGWRCVYKPEAECKHYTLDLAEHKKGSFGEFYFGIRNGFKMRFIYGGMKEWLKYTYMVWSLILFSRHHDLKQKKLCLRAFIVHFASFPHMIKRRKLFKKSPNKSKWIKFYDWDYSKKN